MNKDQYKKMMDEIKIDPTFLEDTKSRIQKLSKEKRRIPFWKKVKKPLLTVGSGLVAAILIFLVIFSQNEPTGKYRVSAQTIEISPTKEANGTIGVDSSFLISYKGEEKPTLKEVKETIKMSPEVNYAIEEKGEGEFVLQTLEPLPTDAIVNLTVEKEKGDVLNSWAFQTENVFKVVSTTPAKGTDYVPVQSGVEVSLSYPNVSLESFQKNFKITPEVKGNFEKRGNRFVFIPSKTLKLNTVYTVTIAGELQTDEGLPLKESTEFAFKTTNYDGESSYSYFDLAGPVSENFLPDDEPLLAVYVDDSFKNQENNLDVSLYQFSDDQMYLDALTQYAKGAKGPFVDVNKPSVDVSKLTKVSDTKTSLLNLTNSEEYSYQPYFIKLPDVLKKGWYYAVVTAKSPSTGQDFQISKFIQVSDFAVYAMEAEGDLVTWVNNSNTGQPMGNAQVEFMGFSDSQSGVTDSKGGLTFKDVKREADPQTGVLSIRSGSQVYYDLYHLSGSEDSNLSKDYYTYIYTDRAIYKNTDTIHVWGMIRPREGDPTLPKDLRVVLGNYERELYSEPIEVSKSGTFTAELSYEKLGGQLESYENISLVSGEKDILVNTAVTISDYVKPIYNTSASSKKPVYLFPDKEPIDVEFEATFFEGTPAPNMKVNIEFYDPTESKTKELTTDQDGKASASFTSYNLLEQWRPYQMGYWITNANPENENFSIGDSVQVLYHDVALRGIFDSKSNQLSIYKNKITLEKIKTEEDLYKGEDYENLMGAPLNGEVTMDLHRVWYEKVPNGTTYDFIQKRNVTKYDYQERDEFVKQERIQVENGVAKVTGLPKSSSKETYYVVLHTKDSRGKDVEEKIYLGSPLNFGLYGYHSYYFTKDYDFQKDTDSMLGTSFKENEDVTFRVKDNGEALRSGKILVAVVQSGVSSVGFEEKPSTVLSYDESLVPNYGIAGAYFDGKHIYPIEMTYMSFNPEGKELEVQVKADREAYGPGDTMNLEVSVRYKGTGEPAKEADVNVSLVDEAIFALGEQDINPLEQLYRGVYMPTIQSYTSYVQKDQIGFGGAEKGGGEGMSGIRADFKDTVAFLTLKTDSKGEGKVSVKLPDNLTKWRITAQAITKDNFAGGLKEGVVVSKDFFLNPIVSQTYLEGEDVSFSLRSNGVGIVPSSPVKYSATLKGKDFEKTVSGQGNAEDYVLLKFGKLSVGTYTLTFAGESGGFQDRIENTIQVVDSRMRVPMRESFNLKEGLSIQPLKFPVEITFYNEDYRFYNEVLKYLTNQVGNRTEERMARQFASEKFQEANENSKGDSFTDVLTTRGEVMPLPYDTADVELAARVHAVVPQYLLGGDSTQVFLDVLNNRESTSSQVAAAYLGLAAHKKPVLNGIYDLLENPKGLLEKDQLVLVAALGELGDYQGAKDYYEKLVLPKLKTENGKDGEKITYYGISKNTEERLTYTAQASLIASVLQTEEASELVRYLVETPSREHLYLLEEIQFLNYFKPKSSSEAVFTYAMDGKTEKVKLSERGMKTLFFTEKELKAANFKVEEGNVYADAFFTTTFKNSALKSMKKATVKKTIETVDGGAMKVGSLVKITVTSTIPSSYAESNVYISDSIPSGMRYVSLPFQEGEETSWSLARRDDALYTFASYHGKGQSAIKPLVYYAQCVTEGEYISEPAFLRIGQTGIWGSSETLKVRIQNEK